jgi:transposase-like protein
VESIGEFYPEAKWQRCTVHFYRNVFSHVPRGKVAEVARMLKAIHAQEDLAAARDKARAVVEKLKGMKLKSAADLVEKMVE